LRKSRQKANAALSKKDGKGNTSPVHDSADDDLNLNRRPPVVDERR
jgi:hypothetical protein